VSLRLVALALLLAPGLTSCSSNPARDDRRVIERGQASWYGRKFQGRRTASGEHFDASGMTAAHRTLQFGTLVEVRSVSSRKSVQVRINDRGPSIRSRIIDLSEAAAKELDLIAKGEDTVEILR
jgi:rare lipoprotein A